VIVGRTTPWTFTESIQVARPGSGSTRRSVARASCRRKAHRIVPSPFFFTEEGDGGLGSSDRRRSRLRRAARSHERATGVSEARSHEATPAKTRGLSVRSGGSGRRRRETSCPSIHRATGLIPRGREVGREPRARVQVDRLVGWQKSVGRIAICNGRSSPREAPRTLTRARGGNRVNRYAMLRTEHSRSARSRPRESACAPACPNTTEGVSARGSMCPLRGSCAAGLVLRVFQSCATAGAVRVVPAG
jgi:hypothetical protein